MQIINSLEDLEKHGSRHNRSDIRAVQSIHDSSIELGANCGFIRSLLKDTKEVKLYAVALDGARIPIDLVIEDEAGSVYLRVEHGTASFNDLVKASNVTCPDCKETLLVPGEGFWRCMNCSVVFHFRENGVAETVQAGEEPIVIPAAEVVR